MGFNLSCICTICILLCVVTTSSSASSISSPRKADSGKIGHFHAQEGTEIRRSLRGSGSLPPICLNKCETCTPCVPVYGPVPPSRPVISEYYPEAWRCSCGGKLYMP